MTHPNKKPGKTQTTRDWILVVDDDEPIRTLITSALASDELEVATASDSPAAFRMLEQHATEPVMVLTDVLMPGMDGLTLARKLHARLTRSKIVIMSGHLTDASWWPADLRDLVFIAKPFRMTDLKPLVEAARADCPRDS